MPQSALLKIPQQCFNTNNIYASSSRICHEMIHDSHNLHVRELGFRNFWMLSSYHMPLYSLYWPPQSPNYHQLQGNENMLVWIERIWDEIYPWTPDQCILRISLHRWTWALPLSWSMGNYVCTSCLHMNKEGAILRKLNLAMVHLETITTFQFDMIALTVFALKLQRSLWCRIIRVIHGISVYAIVFVCDPICIDGWRQGYYIILS